MIRFLDRKALIYMLDHPARKPREATVSDELAQTVCAMVADVLKRDHVTLSDNLVALGATSLELIALANRIEALSGTRPQLTDLARAVDLPDLLALVADLYGDLPLQSAAPIWPGEQLMRSYLGRNSTISDPIERKLFNPNGHCCRVGTQLPWPRPKTSLG